MFWRVLTCPCHQGGTALWQRSTWDVVARKWMVHWMSALGSLMTWKSWTLRCRKLQETSPSCATTPSWNIWTCPVPESLVTFPPCWVGRRSNPWIYLEQLLLANQMATGKGAARSSKSWTWLEARSGLGHHRLKRESCTVGCRSWSTWISPNAPSTVMSRSSSNGFNIALP